MKRIRRIIVKSIMVILLLLCVAATWFYLGVWIPKKTISNSAQWGLGKEHVSDEKIRIACHKILRNWLVGDHDAFLILGHIGNKDSIPILIHALKWQNWQHKKDMEAGEGVVCTYSHCRESLEKLTGMNYGYDYGTWKNWWKQTGRHLPFDEEKGRLTLEGTK